MYGLRYRVTTLPTGGFAVESWDGRGWVVVRTRKTADGAYRAMDRLSSK